MSSAVASDTKDTPTQPQPPSGPPLSLTVDLPLSSPFPSPSSSFLPPPMPGVHEFAIRPPPAGRKKIKDDELQKAPVPPDTTSTEPNALSPVTPSSSSPRKGSFASQPQPPQEPPTIVTPTTTTAQKESQTPSTTTTPTAASTILPIAIATTTTTPPTPPATPPLSSARNSLTSTRPAPPSPAISRRGSRRASGALSTHSTRSSSKRLSSSTSRPNSTIISLSRTSSKRQVPQLQSQPQPQSPLSAVTPTSTPTTSKRRSFLVKIRDFAFSSSDDRHAGMGTDVPKPNRPKTLNKRLNRRDSGMSSTSESSGDGHDDDDDDDDEDGGLSGFKWGFGRWGFGKGVLGGGGVMGRSEDAGPSRMDFARNFGPGAGVGPGPVAGEEDELDDEMEYFDPEDAEGEYDEEEDDGYPENEPLYPGLYRAMYGFEPEGTAEMRLEEDQVVRVVGRGGGLGWAVVVREGEGEEDGRHALVPESYLEPVDGGV